jgi:hypothetical protein
MFELTKANWTPFFGNNHEKLPWPDVYAGGSVRFHRHVGRPLSQELWEDLVHRLLVTGMCIYRPNDGMWTVGWGSGHIIIHLDDKDNVKSFDYFPRHDKPLQGVFVYYDCKPEEIKVFRYLSHAKQFCEEKWNKSLGPGETVEWTEPEPGVYLYNGGVGTIRGTPFS